MSPALAETATSWSSAGASTASGIARDAAGRGLKVLLCEQDDLAAHTSSASTKLIHGGLRYLEEFHFSLVRKALREREVLLARRAAHHAAAALRHAARCAPAPGVDDPRGPVPLRPPRQARAPGGLGARSTCERTSPARRCKPGYRRGFVYSDGWVDDARLVVLNALDAQARGATVLTRTRCERPDRRGRRVERAAARATGALHAWRRARSSTPPAPG